MINLLKNEYFHTATGPWAGGWDDLAWHSCSRFQSHTRGCNHLPVQLGLPHVYWLLTGLNWQRLLAQASSPGGLWGLKGGWGEIKRKGRETDITLMCRRESSFRDFANLRLRDLEVLSPCSFFFFFKYLFVVSGLSCHKGS